MPLSTVCVSTVTGRPKAWSSYTNLPRSNENVKENLRNMNSTEELTTGYHNHTRKHTGYFEYDISDDKPIKKDKKWSFGNLFRRKKKNESSSDEDEKKKRRNNNKKRNNNVTFDHVISTLVPPHQTYHHNQSLQDIPKEEISNFEYINPRNHPNQLSLDSVTRKNRSRELAKFRAEARRTSFNNNSSSDEDSNSSHKFRSDDSLQTLNKKSRAARTERYLKRHSRDGENPYNYLRISKSDAESSNHLKSDESNQKSPSVSPQFNNANNTQNFGLSTIPPSLKNHKPPINEYSTAIKLPHQSNRSISFDADIHMPREDIVHGRLELGRPRMRNFTINDSSSTNLILRQIQPPVPPPRRFQPQLNAKYLKSSSEDYLPSKEPLILAQRPQSTTPEPKSRWYRPTISTNRYHENYQYLTDKQPRSRKPIFIQNNPPPQMFKCETRVEQKIFLPSVVVTTNNNIENIDTDTKIDNELKRKSTNLEEALNELEEIYNSLKLGDEDLLELAEKRENEVVQEELERKGKYPMSSTIRGAMSDSSFNYEPYDSTRRKKRLRKLVESDDMAFRKINREDRAATINDPSKISYLLTNPIYSSQKGVSNHKSDPSEPDITLDDVLYRTIKQSNKIRVPEHPPPFGIPLGPITLASNSDYLHAIPDTVIVKPSRIPDLVKDDLAYRNLRKDNAKEPALPPVSVEDLKNNNFNTVFHPININDSPRLDLAELKKRRAVRSKSANIGSLISQEVIERASRRNARDKNVINECQTLSDIADAMQIAREVLREKETRIAETKRASFSDTDTSNLRYRRRSGTKPILENIKSDGEIEDFYKTDEVFRTSSFEDALTALAIEAKEASDKFTKRIEEFDAKEIEANESEHDYENLNEAKFDKNDNSKDESQNLGEEIVVDVVLASSNVKSDNETISNSKFSQKLGCGETLKSPKLVLEMSKNVDRGCGSVHENFSRNRNCSDIGRQQLQRHNDDVLDSFKSSSAWHNNPTTAFAIACGLACFHELISVDLFAFFSIIFAVLTFISSFFS